MAADVAVVVDSYLGDGYKTDKHITTLLKCIKENQCLRDNESCKVWTAKVNSCLNSKNDRWLGITLLATTIEQCDTETFTLNCLTWIKAILHVVQSSSSSTCLLQCSVRLIDDLLKYAIQFPDISRTVSNSVIPPLLSALLSRRDKDVSIVLSGICSCVRYIPGPVKPFRGQIESYIIPCLDSWNVDIRKKSCLCFALLAGCISGTSSTDKCKTNWETQWSRVLSVINDTLNNLYKNITWIDTALNDTLVANTDILAVSIVTDEEPMRTNLLTTRLMSLLDCLIMMIREGTQGISAIPFDETLGVIERIVAINDNMLKSVSIDVVLLKTCQPATLHENAISLIYSLIHRCGSLLLTNSKRIANILMRELSWTLDNQATLNHGVQKVYSNLRCAIFKCFINWLHLKASISADVVNKVVRNVLSDIRPQSSQTKLMKPEDQKQSKSSKKAKKRKLQEIEQLSSNHKKENPFDNLSICHTALSALYAILMNGVGNITKDIYQEVQSLVLDLIIQCQMSLPGRMPSPYSDPECRKSLYQCLLACVLARPPQAPTSIQCAIRCYTRGLQDTHYMVSGYCREALTILAAVIHPIVPSLDSASQFVMLPSKSTPSMETQYTEQQETSSSSTQTVNQNCTDFFEVSVHNCNEPLGNDDKKWEGCANGMYVSPGTNGETKHGHARGEISGVDSTVDCQHSTISNGKTSIQQQSTGDWMETQAGESTGPLDVQPSLEDQSAIGVDKANSEGANEPNFDESMQNDSRHCLPKKNTLQFTESIEVISAKRQKLDGDFDGNIDKKTEEMEHRRLNNNDTCTGMNKDAASIDEMLASFVDACPDSDSD